MVGWHLRLKGRGFEQTLGDSEGQGSLTCCSPRGCKESYESVRINLCLILTNAVLNSDCYSWAHVRGKSCS